MMMYPALYPRSMTSPAQTDSAISSLLGVGAADAASNSMIPNQTPYSSTSGAQFEAPQLSSLFQALYMILQFLSSMMGQMMSSSAAGSPAVSGAPGTGGDGGTITPYSAYTTSPTSSRSGRNVAASDVSGPGKGGSVPSKSGHENIDRWDAAIQKAAESTGLPTNYIKATMWAESRGNPNETSKNPDGQHEDLGLMQISDYTYSDVMKDQPNAPRGLKASNVEDNIMMGAWELKDKLDKAHGDYQKTSEAYVGTGDSSYNAKYAHWVMGYWQELDQGKPLSDH